MEVLDGCPMILVRTGCGNARVGAVEDMVGGQLVIGSRTRRTISQLY